MCVCVCLYILPFFIIKHYLRTIKQKAQEMTSTSCKMSQILNQLHKWFDKTDTWRQAKQKISAYVQEKEKGNVCATKKQKFIEEIRTLVTQPVFDKAKNIAMKIEKDSGIPATGSESPSKRRKITETDDKNGDDDYCLEDKFCCPICFCYFGEKIFQCSNGHSICENCKISLNVKGSSCPTCLVYPPDFSMRNRTLEAISVSVKLPCDYKKNSCSYKGDFYERQKHIESCACVDLACPVHECKFVSTARGILKHMRDEHNQDRYNRSLCDNRYKTTLELDVDDCESDLLPLYYDGRLFILKITPISIFQTTEISACLLHPYAKESSSYEMHVVITNETSDTFSVTFRNMVPCKSISSDDVFKSKFFVGWIPKTSDIEKGQQISLDVHVRTHSSSIVLA